MPIQDPASSTNQHASSFTDLEEGFIESSGGTEEQSASHVPDYVVRGCGVSLPLYKFETLPEFLKCNPYIRKGYRLYLSNADSLRSIFLWTNETINIWSHLLGFLYFAAAIVHANLYYLPAMSGPTPQDHMVVTYYLLSVMCTMLFSVTFHVFTGHSSHQVYMFWFRLDICGIVLAVWGCYATGTYYAFYCFPYWQKFYFSVTILLTVVTVLLPMLPGFLENSMHRTRIAVFVGMVLSSLVPVNHWLSLNGGFQHPDVILFFPRVLFMWFVLAVGVIFYASKAPEKCCPGRCDFVGHSHQLWHASVFLALAYWHYNGISMIKYRHELPCSDVVMAMARSPQQLS